MSSTHEQIELLVRAFKAAWNRYFETDRDKGVLECLARPALAEFLVSQVKDGVDDFSALAAAGLEFLYGMEDPLENVDDPGQIRWNLRLEHAKAYFVPVGHVRWLPNAYG